VGELSNSKTLKQLKAHKKALGILAFGLLLAFFLNATNALQAGLPAIQENQASTDQFLFYGPTELTKNQSGEYEIVRMPGGGSSSSPSQVYDGRDTVVEFITTDEFGNVVDYNVTEPIEISPADLNNHVFPTVFQPTRVGTFTVHAIIYQEGTPIQTSMILDGETLLTGNQKTVNVSIPSNLLEITNFSIPGQISKGSLIPVIVPVQNTGGLDANAFLEISFVNDENEISEVFASQEQEILSGELKIFEINAQVMVPAGDYNVIASVFFDNQKISLSAQTIVTLGQTPRIQSVALPLIVEADSTLNFQVTLHNDTNAALQPVVYAFLIDGNETKKTFSDSNILLAPNETQAVEFEWTVEQPAKAYTMKTEAWTENSTQTVEQAVQIVDSQPPIFENISFQQTVWKNAPLKVNAQLSDFSSIQNAEILIDGQTVPMNKISGTDSNAEFEAAITQTTTTGQKNFQINACDGFGNCSQSSQAFLVEQLPASCNGRLALIVQDNDKINLPTPGQEWILDSSQITGCSAEWPTKELNTPPLAFLERFRPVFWSNANHFSDTIDENEAGLLSQFAAGGGRLFIEGSDISSEHAFDQFSENTLKAGFVQEIGQAQSSPSEPEPPQTQTWWDSNWTYRKNLTITAVSLIDSNHTLTLSLDTFALAAAGKMQPECDDLRVVFGNQELDRKVVGCNASDTNVFFKTGQANQPWQLQPSESDSNFFVYYGNPNAAVPPSNPDNVFENASEYYALYRFENNLNLDSSTNARHLEVIGAPLIQNDNYFFLSNEAARSFPGNHVKRDNFGALSAGTIEILFEIKKISSNDIIATFGANNDRFQLTAQGNQVMSCLSPGNPLINVPAFNTGEVHHFACTFDQASKKTYWDGELIETAPAYFLSNGTMQLGGIEPTSSDETFITVGISPFAKTSFNFLKNKPQMALGTETTQEPANPQPAAGWWNPDWKARIPIQITPSFSATHYQLRLALNQATLGWGNAVDFYTNAREGLEDIRFVDPQTNTELPFWREPAADTPDPIEWVRVPGLVAGTPKTIYIYYANPDANVSTLAQYEQTFDLVDDFSDGEMNNGPTWTQAKNGGNDWVVPSGIFLAENSSTTGTQYASTFAGMASAKIINSRVTMQGSNLPTAGYEYKYHLFKTDAGFNTGELTLLVDPNPRIAKLIHEGTGTICQGNYPNGLPDYFTVTRGIYGAFRLYKGDHSICLGVDNLSPSKAFIGFSHAGGGTMKTDNIYTMKFQSTYPQVSFQPAEQYFDAETIQFFASAPQEFSLTEATIDFNSAPYADAVFADQNAFAIAGWSQEKQAITGWQQDNADGTRSKTIFMPISLAAFTPQDRNAILSASLEWLNGGN